MLLAVLLAGGSSRAMLASAKSLVVFWIRLVCGLGLAGSEKLDPRTTLVRLSVTNRYCIEAAKRTDLVLGDKRYRTE